MDVTNEVMPTSRERIGEMMEPGPDGPIFMINLLKFKERAEYEDGRATDLSGRSLVSSTSKRSHHRPSRDWLAPRQRRDGQGSAVGIEINVPLQAGSGNREADPHRVAGDDRDADVERVAEHDRFEALDARSSARLLVVAANTASSQEV